MSSADSLLRDPDFNPASVSLGELRKNVWQQLSAACGDLNHPWRLPVLATTAGQQPHQRILVLRRVDPNAATLFGWTDIRSPKVVQLQANSMVSWLFYDPQARVQLTMWGSVQLHVSDSIADREWTAASLASRRAYLAESSPGTPAECPSVNLPTKFQDRLPTEEEAAAGRANFVVLSSVIDHFDVLFIRRNGNLRFCAERTSHGWKESWLEP